MNVVWSATSPRTRRVGAVMRTEFEGLAVRFAELRVSGEGYLAVELPTDGSPQVTLGFRADDAVVQQLSDLDSEPKSFLLVGDGRIAPDRRVGVPFMDDDALFTGDFVMSVDRAWGAVRDFVRSGFTADLGEWYEL